MIQGRMTITAEKKTTRFFVMSLLFERKSFFINLININAGGIANNAIPKNFVQKHKPRNIPAKISNFQSSVVRDLYRKKAKKINNV